MADTSPTVRHRRLAAELRRLRERADLTPARAAAALGWSRPKLVQVETAKGRLTPAEVEAIINAYGTADRLAPALLQLANDIHKRGWWTAYGGVLPESFAELEDAASSIRALALEIVPGLLQTADYALELIRAETNDEAEIERRLGARQHRQTVLHRRNAPTLGVLLHEAVLRAEIDGVEVMRTQLAALRTLGRRDNISIRVLPTTVGVRPGIGEGSFTIFGFPEALDFDVVHLETVLGDIYGEDIKQVERCSVVYERTAGACLSEEESAGFIADLIEE